MQCGEKHLGERIRILLASDDFDGLPQLGEGRLQGRRSVLGGEMQSGGG